MSFIQFESSRDKEAQRNVVRQARAKILADAEEKFHKKAAQAERAKQRGDNKWMLPALEEKLSGGKKKKKKKEKKSKKSKKKKRRHSTSSSSSDSSDDEKGEWVEKSTDTPKPSALSTADSAEPKVPLVRDEWMNMTGSFLCSSRDKNPKQEVKRPDTCILDKPGQNARELNPYWKDGGMGLPEDLTAKQNTAGPTMSVEWLKKSLQRAEEQAEEEGKSLDEIAEARWGSLDKIKSMIAEAEKTSRQSTNRRDHNNDKYHRRSDYRRAHRDRSRSRSRSRERSRSSRHDYKNDFIPSKKLVFQKPGDDDHHSSSTRHSSSSQRGWRKPEANERIGEEQQKIVASKSSAISQRKFEQTNKPEKEEKPSASTGKSLTDDELNKLGSRIIKAELMGDMELAGALKLEMENAREARKKPMETAKDDNVILTTTDSRGMARPLEPRSRYEEPQGGRGRNKKKDTHEGGVRVRYFADDDKLSLHDMFQREKGQSVDDDDAVFVKMASKSMDMDELFEERITRGPSDAKKDLRDKKRAIAEHQRMEKSMENCRLCIDSTNMQKHLIVSMSNTVHLSLPWHESFTLGHCILSPLHHVSCQTQADEDVTHDIKEYKRALTKMYTARNECPVFFEIYLGQHRAPHMKLECIPLPEEIGSMAPMYFKKALLECETEWSTNKKVVDLNEKDVRQVIPKGLPYFVVDFGTGKGFAHVIEDTQLFPRNFAQEIIGGMLDLDSNKWRRPRKENFDRQKQKVIDFAEIWKNYDFTADSD